MKNTHDTRDTRDTQNTRNVQPQAQPDQPVEAAGALPMVSGTGAQPYPPAAAGQQVQYVMHSPYAPGPVMVTYYQPPPKRPFLSSVVGVLTKLIAISMIIYGALLLFGVVLAILIVVLPAGGISQVSDDTGRQVVCGLPTSIFLLLLGILILRSARRTDRYWQRLTSAPATAATYSMLPVPVTMQPSPAPQPHQPPQSSQSSQSSQPTQPAGGQGQ
jgi:hypothetical protein